MSGTIRANLIALGAAGESNGLRDAVLKGLQTHDTDGNVSEVAELSGGEVFDETAATDKADQNADPGSTTIDAVILPNEMDDSDMATFGAMLEQLSCHEVVLLAIDTSGAGDADVNYAQFVTLETTHANVRVVFDTMVHNVAFEVAKLAQLAGA